MPFLGNAPGTSALFARPAGNKSQVLSLTTHSALSNMVSAATVRKNMQLNSLLIFVALTSSPCFGFSFKSLVTFGDSYTDNVVIDFSKCVLLNKISCCAHLSSSNRPNRLARLCIPILQKCGIRLRLCACGRNVLKQTNAAYIQTRTGGSDTRVQRQHNHKAHRTTCTKNNIHPVKGWNLRSFGKPRHSVFDLDWDKRRWRWTVAHRPTEGRFDREHYGLRI
jgi:hypothetical protein